jgi:hypothetical protein
MSPRRISRIGSSQRSSPVAAGEDELVDEQVIADEQVRLHRSGRDLERLEDERAHEQREDHGNAIDSKYSRAVVVERRVSHYSSPIFSTARKASRDFHRATRFMRLPSFCFSSSLRLRGCRRRSTWRARSAQRLDRFARDDARADP